ncbi:hypothetical protein RND81_11G183100 [Saponaria officinalis]|uniref:DUF6598 domain-containing protein n=1 Tax=Saponaria officinalis TaxID=3572 RepID=A0AAW1HNI1_SAPOF
MFRFMTDYDIWDAKEIPIENEKWLFQLKTPGMSVFHTLAAPASELFSVRVSPTYFGQRHSCEIYGTILLRDRDGSSYELYSRTPDDAQTLTPEHNVVSLDMPVECLLSTTWWLMCVTLKDKALDTVIADDVLPFHNVIYNNEYNGVNVLEFADDSIFVTYAAFLAAVVAVVDIILIKKDNSVPPPAADLYGKIVARCGNTYGQKYPGTMLFDRPSSQSIKASSNTSIELSRDVVVVPAYSFLRIDLHLSLHQLEDISGHAEFLAESLRFGDDVDIHGNDFIIRVKVLWFHPYEMKKPIVEPPFKRPEISTELQAHDVTRDHSLPEVHELVEVFTLMIHHNTYYTLKMCGELRVRDNFSRFMLFNRNETNPLIFSKNEETIPIDASRRCFSMCENFYMGLDLRDVEGRVLIEGDIIWAENVVQKPISWWYDRRICSVIRGIHGYAAVFYTIFSEARQAEVKVSFKCDDYPDVSHCVHGTVVARRSNEIYSTEHDIAYYQSVLFRGKFSELKSGFTLPLSKSVVAVPIDSFLTVCVDLYATPLSHEVPQEYATPLSHEVPQECLKQDIDFQIIPGSKRIQGKNHSIEVSVEWSDLRKLFSEEMDLIRRNAMAVF